MVKWHHEINGQEQYLGDGEGQELKLILSNIWEMVKDREV